MQYKNKLITISVICGALFIAYILTFVFAPERVSRREAAWTLLTQKNIDSLERMTINVGETVNMEKDGDSWWVLSGDRKFPANAERINDLFSGLKRQGPFVVRSKSEKTFEKFGVDEGSATRITLFGANNAELLDLLIGSVVSDLEAENYFRKAGETEVRSGPVFARQFLIGGRKVWLDLRLFPDHEKNGLNGDLVQRAAVYMPKTGVGAAENDKPKEDWIIARSGDGWKFEGRSTDVDNSVAEEYVRFVFDANGEDFVSSLSPLDKEFTAEGNVPGRIVLDLGDGRRILLTLGPEVNDKKTLSITGNEYVYTLAPWYVVRLWRDVSELEVKSGD